MQRTATISRLSWMTATNSTVQDPLLCRLSDALMERVTLVHFRENVENGRMTFDYKLRPGPVTAGNALRLMQLIGLPVPLD